MPHGKDSVFWLDDTAGSLTDISQYVTNVSGLPGSIDMAETTTFGKEAKTYEPGLSDAQITVEVIWNATLDGYIGTDAQRKVARSFESGPDGGGSGDVKYSGECYIQNVDIPQPVGDVVKATLTLQVTDAITRGTFA